MNSTGRNPSEGKGRQLDEQVLFEIKGLLSPPFRRDLLIEYLHSLQDHYGYLGAPHLRALAELMRLGQAEVYEVASFYDHFDLVREGDTQPPPLTLRVCDSLSCMMAGAEPLIAALSKDLDQSKVRLVRAPCMGRCDSAPAARLGNKEIGGASRDNLLHAIQQQDTAANRPDYCSLDAYRKTGGYDVLLDLRKGVYKADDLIALLTSAGLRGLGGAGFPAGQKWTIVRSYPGPRLMTINGDEGEPGTFKDRTYLESNPHAMLEGALIAALIVEAERIYLYLRDEYPAARLILKKEIMALEAEGLITPGFIELRRGAGAYICGEESAMIESIEGKRGLPRHRPPFIAEKGLFGQPTLNHNIETLYWLPEIFRRGAEWFKEQGSEAHPGFRSYSVSGRVREPGVKIAPAGISVTKLIEDYCGGMAEGHEFTAYLPGGASGGILPASLGDIPLDFGGKLAELGAFVGSHAVIILSNQDSIRNVVINLMSFFSHESCGQCTPCRSGTKAMLALLEKDEKPDRQTIDDLEQVMRDASICGLGQAAPNPVRHYLTWFCGDEHK